ncbi:hypothetical protein D3C81_1693020 [compost metagenome]
MLGHLCVQSVQRSPQARCILLGSLQRHFQTLVVRALVQRFAQIGNGFLSAPQRCLRDTDRALGAGQTVDQATRILGGIERLAEFLGLGAQGIQRLGGLTSCGRHLVLATQDELDQALFETGHTIPRE